MTLNFGIDFGTSTLIISKWNEQKQIPEIVPHIVPGLSGAPGQIDNIVYYDSPTEITIGRTALNKLGTKPHLGEREIKRHIADDLWLKNIHGVDKTPVDIMEDIFTYIESQLRKIYGNEEIDNVIISVPYAFEQKERKKIEQAALNSKLPVIGLIEEPVAAALASGLFDLLQPNQKENVFIFDLGGGTFDVTIFEASMKDDGTKSIAVLNTDGDSKLGGVDIDSIIMNRLISEIKIGGTDPVDTHSLPEDVKASLMIKLFDEARIIKHDLSEADEAMVFIAIDEVNDAIVDFIFLREELEAALEKEIIPKIKSVVDRVLKGANLTESQIDEIVLVGGSSNIPLVANTIEKIFNRLPKTIDDPSDLVGKGAAVYCGICANEVNDIEILRRTNQGFGIKQKNQVKLLLKKNDSYHIPSPYLDIIIPEGKLGGKIPIFQSSGTQLEGAEKIGHLKVLTKNYERNQVRIQLQMSEYGSLCYRTYNISGELVSQGNVVEF